MGDGGKDDKTPTLPIGLLTGKLAFSDELASIFLVLLWSSLSDRLGISIVAALGYCLISFGLMSYALATKPWPHLLWARLIFAGGGSAVTAMLTASLAAFSCPNVQEAPATAPPPPTAAEEAAPFALHGPDLSERTPLLPSEDRPTTSSPAKSRHGRLASLAGLFTGVGALIAVFLLLPLPVWLASLHEAKSDSHTGSGGPDDPAVQKGTREAFLIVACLALCSAASVAIGLRHPEGADKSKGGGRRQRLSRATSVRQAHGEADRQGQEDEPQLPSVVASRQARRERLRNRLQSREASGSYSSVALRGLANVKSSVVDLARRSLDGYRLAWQDKTGRVALAYLGGALARAVTIGSTVFLPLLISHYFYTTNPSLCPPPSTSPSIPTPPSELKKTCRQAYTLTSAQSGILQTVALLLAPIVGLASDAIGAEIVLGLGASLGMIACAVYALALPGEGDPRVPRAWIAAAVLGLTQISAIITSLSLIASLTSSSSSSSPSPTSSPTPITDHQHQQPCNRQNDHPTTISISTPGSLAGGYSSSGALCILLFSSLAGILFDIRPQAPFLLLAALATIVALAAAGVVLKERRRKRTKRTRDSR